MDLTEKQKETIAMLKKRWGYVSEPSPLPCDDCVLVQVGKDSSHISMTIGVEADGS